MEERPPPIDSRIQIRCKGTLKNGNPCNRRLADAIGNKESVYGLKLKCSKCGFINII